MNISLLIALVVAALIICNKNISEVAGTIVLVVLVLLFDRVCFAILTDNEIFGNLSTIWEIIIIAIMIIPWLWIKNDIMSDKTQIVTLKCFVFWLQLLVFSLP